MAEDGGGMTRKRKPTKAQTARDKMEEIRRLIREGMEPKQAWDKVDPWKDNRTQ